MATGEGPPAVADFNKGARRGLLAKLSSEPLDVLVLGGGITGASIFRDAALRNMRVGLVEAHDFGSGTSGRSSKLVHGGLRYLENLRFRRAWEASHERDLHLDLNGRFVKPVPILIPTYRRGGDAPAKVRVAMWLYRMMSGLRNSRHHRFLDRAETLKMGPGLESRRLTGGVVYHDAIVDDARWTLETIKDGVRHGGTAVNHAPVIGLVKAGPSIGGATVRDALDGRAYSIDASIVINATGAWADQIREMDRPGRPAMVRLSKGTHLVLAGDDVPLNVSCVFPSPLDGRHLFLIRRDGCFLYGTTDDWHDGLPDAPRPGEIDTAYLMEAIDRFFPGSSLTRSSVLYCYSGYRALPSAKASGSAPWSVGREDMVEVAQSGLGDGRVGKAHDLPFAGEAGAGPTDRGVRWRERMVGLPDPTGCLSAGAMARTPPGRTVGRPAPRPSPVTSRPSTQSMERTRTASSPGRRPTRVVRPSAAKCGTSAAARWPAPWRTSSSAASRPCRGAAGSAWST